MRKCPDIKRQIVGFVQDEHGDWIALLECGHRQHVRHDPPFVERPWVTTASGRRARIGEALRCRACVAEGEEDG